jgi:hypothetical protein
MFLRSLRGRRLLKAAAASPSLENAALLPAAGTAAAALCQLAGTWPLGQLLGMATQTACSVMFCVVLLEVNNRCVTQQCCSPPFTGTDNSLAC